MSTGTGACAAPCGRESAERRVQRGGERGAGVLPPGERGGSAASPCGPYITARAASGAAGRLGGPQ